LNSGGSTLAVMAVLCGCSTGSKNPNLEIRNKSE
jgi:hypothetical protein